VLIGLDELVKGCATDRRDVYMSAFDYIRSDFTSAYRNLGAAAALGFLKWLGPTVELLDLTPSPVESINKVSQSYFPPERQKLDVSQVIPL